MNKRFGKVMVDAEKFKDLVDAARNILWHWENGHISIDSFARNCMTLLEEALEELKKGGEQNE